MQSTNNVFLVKPSNFSYNAETAETNPFQNKIEKSDVNKMVKKEFDNFANVLISSGINVNIYQDTVLPVKPDSIFPNNWISFHENSMSILYPMSTPNRRPERRLDIISDLSKKFNIKHTVDFSNYENDGKFLEGTGSIVFDRINKIAYASLSPRTNKEVLEKVCNVLEYTPITFSGYDSNGIPIYHTNVLMSIGTKYSTVCLSSIKDKNEQKIVRESLEKTAHQIIDISFEQMYNFAGNMLELRDKNGCQLVIMSQRAYQSLSISQKTSLQDSCKIVNIPISTIETIGGGSARCMIAEIFS